MDLPRPPFLRRPVRSAVLAAGLVAGGDLAAQEVRVRVTEEGAPVPSAEVMLRAGHGALVGWGLTDGRGTVRIPAPGGGDFLVRVRRIGYAIPPDRAVPVASAGVTDVTVELAPAAVVLEGLEVEAVRRRRRLDALGFYRRRDSWPGVFFEREQVDSLRPRGMNELLRRIPFVLFRWDERGRRYPYFRGGQAGWTRICFPVLFVDGRRLGGGRDAIDVETAVHPDDVVAMEVYPGAASVPSRFNSSDSGCGVIAVWTR